MESCHGRIQDDDIYVIARQALHRDAFPPEGEGDDDISFYVCTVLEEVAKHPRRSWLRRLDAEALPLDDVREIFMDMMETSVSRGMERVSVLSANAATHQCFQAWKCGSALRSGVEPAIGNGPAGVVASYAYGLG